MYFELWVIGIAILILFFLLDDLIIDITAFIYRLKPEPISKSILEKEDSSLPLAIMIANWKESEVLEYMVKGNFLNMPSKEKTYIFLGVYPNDLETKEIALKLSREIPNVIAVINPLKGPTYKGQMLNVVIDEIFNTEKKLGLLFEGFILHDSEDVLSPLQTQLYRYALSDNDFIQTPVLSLPLKSTDFVGGTYLDEFAEMHTKELLVRQYLGASLPSAGVGTCISRSLIRKIMFEQGGDLFLPNSLTEDYNLGLLTKSFDFNSGFLCHFLEGDSCKKIIGTREYFPNEIWSSVKQKTRWVTGISFQGYQKFGWFGNFWEHYFLWRDRRGPVGALIVVNSFVILIGMALNRQELLFNRSLIQTFMFINLIGLGYKALIRVFLVTRVAGLKEGLLSVIRWPFSVFINSAAGFRSTYQYYMSRVTGKTIKWSKTTHKIPELFNKNILTNKKEEEGVSV